MSAFNAHRELNKVHDIRHGEHFTDKVRLSLGDWGHQCYIRLCECYVRSHYIEHSLFLDFAFQT